MKEVGVDARLSPSPSPGASQGEESALIIGP